MTRCLGLAQLRGVGYPEVGGYVGSEIQTPGDSCPNTEQVPSQGEPRAARPTAQNLGCGLGQSRDETREHGWGLVSMT